MNRTLIKYILCVSLAIISQLAETNDDIIGCVCNCSDNTEPLNGRVFRQEGGSVPTCYNDCMEACGKDPQVCRCVIVPGPDCLSSGIQVADAMEIVEDIESMHQESSSEFETLKQGWDLYWKEMLKPAIEAAEDLAHDRMLSEDISEYPVEHLDSIRGKIEEMEDIGEELVSARNKLFASYQNFAACLREQENNLAVALGPFEKLPEEAREVHRQVLFDRCVDNYDSTGESWWPRGDKPDWWLDGPLWNQGDCEAWKNSYRDEDVDNIFSWCFDVVDDWDWWVEKYDPFERWDRKFRILWNCQHLRDLDKDYEEKLEENADKKKLEWESFREFIQRKIWKDATRDTIKSTF